MRFFLVFVFGILFNNYIYAEQLIIGTLAYDPPFETAADQKGDYFGFEMDLMNEICRRMNDQCKYKPFYFKQLMIEVQSGTIDLAIAGITITNNRRLSYLFSLPYLKSNAQLLTTSTSNINAPKDINGKRLGFEAGTLFKKLVQQKYNNMTIIEYKTQTDLFQGIANNEVDIIILDEISATFWVTNNNSQLKLVDDSIPVGEGYGIMANFSKQDLISRINNTLIDMENDGTYLAIYKRYF